MLLFRFDGREHTTELLGQRECGFPPGAGMTDGKGEVPASAGTTESVLGGAPAEFGAAGGAGLVEAGDGGLVGGALQELLVSSGFGVDAL